MSVKKTAATAGGAGVIACAVAFTPIWEGMDKVAARDRIGTGHPITYCNGLTSVDGKVKVGQRFTKQECDERLAEALPKYLAQIEPCIHVAMPDKTKAALLDAAYNAGPAAVCRSPMVAKMNAGNLRAGCNAFAGWYVRSDGKVRAGLIDRRDGEDHGDTRQSEKGLCLQGLKEGTWSADGAISHAAKSINVHNKPSVATEVTDVQPPDACGGEWVDDRTYTSHPECRKPETAAAPAAALIPAAHVAAPAAQKHWWTSWVFR